MKKLSTMIGIMMLLSMLGSLFLIGNVSATAIAVPGEHLTIQKAIDNSSDGDIITVGDGFYVEDININRGIILKSENGSATTWINGTVNITASNLTLGGESVGFYNLSGSNRFNRSTCNQC